MVIQYTQPHTVNTAAMTKLFDIWMEIQIDHLVLLRDTLGIWRALTPVQFSASGNIGPSANQNHRRRENKVRVYLSVWTTTCTSILGLKYVALWAWVCIYWVHS
jgi:hypothetical protein